MALPEARIVIINRPDKPCIFDDPYTCNFNKLDINLKCLMFYAEILKIKPVFLRAFGYGDTTEGIKRNDTIFGMLLGDLADLSGVDVMYTEKGVEHGIIGSPPTMEISNHIHTLKSYLSSDANAGIMDGGLLTILLLVTLFVATEIVVFSAIRFHRMNSNRKWGIRVSNVNFVITGLIVNIILNYYVGGLAITLFRKSESMLPFQSVTDLIDLAHLGKWKIITRPFSAYENSMLEWTKSYRPDQLQGLIDNIVHASYDKYPDPKDLRSLLEYELMKNSHKTFNYSYLPSQIPNSAVVTSSFDYARHWAPQSEITTIFDESLGGIPAGFVFRPNVSERLRLSYYDVDLIKRRVTQLQNQLITEQRIKNLEAYLKTLSGAAMLTKPETQKSSKSNQYALLSPLIIGLAIGVVAFLMEFVISLRNRWCRCKAKKESPDQIISVGDGNNARVDIQAALNPRKLGRNRTMWDLNDSYAKSPRVVS